MVTEGVTSEAQVTVRNAAWLLAQRAAHAASGVVFALIVPRLMGPEIYGRYALLVSTSIWMLMLSSLALPKVIARYAPEFLLAGDSGGLQGFYRDLASVRLGCSILAAGLYFVATSLWLADIDSWVLLIVAGTVLVRANADMLFSVFIGLNRAARWQVGETLRQWLSLVMLLPGFYLGGLRGAVTALLLTELLVLSVGIWWTRSHLTWPRPHLDVRRSLPYLRFGLVFFASDVVDTAHGASGESLVRAATGNYAQVAYFGVANRMFATLALAIPQLTTALVPLLTALLAQGDRANLRRWVERLLVFLLVIAVFAVFGVLLLADDFIPVMLGEAYRPVTATLLPLTVTLVPLAVGHTARLLAVVYTRPRTALAASALRLSAFWLVGVPLVVALGSVGSGLAALGASLLFAGYFTWHMRPVLLYSLREGALAVGAGLLYLPLVWFKSSWGRDVILFAGFAVGYAVTLLASGAVTRGEVAELWNAVASRQPQPDRVNGEQ